jgi:hypothetical protein
MSVTWIRVTDVTSALVELRQVEWVRAGRTCSAEQRILHDERPGLVLAAEQVEDEGMGQDVVLTDAAPAEAA